MASNCALNNPVNRIDRQVAFGKPNVWVSGVLDDKLITGAQSAKGESTVDQQALPSHEARLRSASLSAQLQPCRNADHRWRGAHRPG
jgi:hypothetical protein